jgi:cell division protease FtsH
MGDDTARIIDEEVRSVIDRNYERAHKLLGENIDILHKMAETLIKYETIDVSQIDALMERREPPPPADWDDNLEPPPAGPSGGVGADTGAKPADKAKTGKGSIGGPANQH